MGMEAPVARGYSPSGESRNGDDSASDQAPTPLRNPFPRTKVRSNRPRKSLPGSSTTTSTNLSSSSLQSDVWTQFALPSIKYLVDVAGKILALLKWPLALFLTVTLARYLVTRSLGRVTALLQDQITTSICAVPFASPFINQVSPGLCTGSSFFSSSPSSSSSGSSSPLWWSWLRPTGRSEGSSEGGTSRPLDFNDIIDLQKQAAGALPQALTTRTAPLRLKKAELATSDLRILLAGSDLSCKETLDTALLSFAKNAREGSRAIQRTMVRMGGFLDTSLALNEWARQELVKAEARGTISGANIEPGVGGRKGGRVVLGEGERRQGWQVTRQSNGEQDGTQQDSDSDSPSIASHLSSILSLGGYNPITSVFTSLDTAFSFSPSASRRRRRRAATTRAYVQAMDTLAASLGRLIESNTQAYASLDAIEEDLHAVSTILHLERASVDRARADAEPESLLGAVWDTLTSGGRNWGGVPRHVRDGMNRNLAVLVEFERERKDTKDVVARTSVAFHEMMLQIEYLREEVARPGLGRDDVPIEMHIRTIELGIEALKGTRDGRLASVDANEDMLLS